MVSYCKLIKGPPMHDRERRLREEIETLTQLLNDWNSQDEADGQWALELLQRVLDKRKQQVSAFEED